MVSLTPTFTPAPAYLPFRIIPRGSVPLGAISRFGDGGLKAMAVSSKADFLATAVGSRIAVYQLDSNLKKKDLSANEIWSTSAPDQFLLGMALSPDGSMLAYNANNSVLLWDVTSRLQIRTLKGHQQQVRDIAFSPDGKTLATGSEYVILWDAVGGNQIRKLVSYSPAVVNSLAFSPDGTRLAVGYTDHVTLWSAADGVQIRTFDSPANVNSLSFSPDGALLAAGLGNGTVILWNPINGNQVRILKGHNSAVSSVAFSPDGATLAAGTYYFRVVLWDVASGEQRGFIDYMTEVFDVAYLPSGILVTGSDDSISLFEAYRTHMTAFKKINAIAFSPDGAILASGSEDGNAILWEVMTGNQIRTLMGSNMVLSVAFSPDGKMLATGTCNLVHLWDVNQGREIRTLDSHSYANNCFRSVAFSPDGKILAAGAIDTTTTLWDVSTGQLILALGTTGPIQKLAFSPDGKTLVVGANDNSISFWDVASGQKIRTFTDADGILSMALSPDGAVVASAGPFPDHPIVLWDVNTGEKLHTLIAHGRVDDLAFSPDGKILASGVGNSMIILWDAARGTQLHVFPEGAQSLSFSPDGSILASGASDRTILLWDVKDVLANTPILPIPAPGTEGRSQAVPLQAGQPLVFTSLNMMDSTTGWGIATGGQLLRTGDAGSTWREVTPPGSQVFFFLDADTAWATSRTWCGWGEYCSNLTVKTATVYRTTDGGRSWQPGGPIPLGLSASQARIGYLPDLFFLDSQNGWLRARLYPGSSGQVFQELFKTANGGLTWEKVADPSEFPVICDAAGPVFIDVLEGWMEPNCIPGIIPAPGLDDFTILKSIDGGRGWQAEKLPLPADMPAELSQADPGLIYCASGQITPVLTKVLGMELDCTLYDYYNSPQEIFKFYYLTPDGGRSWHSWRASSSEAFIDAVTGWRLFSPDPGSPNQLQQTRDGGLTWAVLKTVGWQSARMQFLDGHEGWAIVKSGDSTALVHTRDGGRTWTETKPVLAAR